MPRNDKFNIPSFYGALDPTNFIDWLIKMENYFKRYNLEDGYLVELAELKLVDMAKTY